MSFKKLLDELDTLRKSHAADSEADESIVAAAAAGDSDEELEDAEAAAAAGDDGEEGLAKSYEVILPNGDKAQGFDGMALIKSMQASLGAIQTERTEDHETLSKALTGIMEVIDEQGKLIKSLNAQLAKVSSEGAGRRSVTVAPVPLVKSHQNISELAPGEVLAKCEAAFNAGKISGLDLSMAEASVNRNMPVSDRIAAKLDL